VSANATLRLTDRHRDGDERHPVSVTLVRLQHPGVQSLAVLAPGGPEFDKHGPMAEVLSEVYFTTLHVRQGESGRHAASLDPDSGLLRGRRGRVDGPAGQGQRERE